MFVVPVGLLLLSRYPIVESMYHRFALNGKPHKILHCDYLGAKVRLIFSNSFLCV